MMVTDVSPEMEITLRSLSKNHFEAHLAQTVSEARDIMLKLIPPAASVGVGDSVTLRQLGIMPCLAERGNKVINPFVPEITRGIRESTEQMKRFVAAQRQTFGTDVFLAGANAVTMDGKIISVDRAGNRVAGMIFAAEKVIIPVGRNKIVKDFDGAVSRIKNVIVPAHTRQKQRRTPCAVTGKCNDCDSPDRLCSVMVTLEKRPSHTHISVILIDADLGLGWDPGWDPQRIESIREAYAANTWSYFKNKIPPKAKISKCS